MNQAARFATFYNADRGGEVPQAAALAAGATWDEEQRAYRWPDGSGGRFASDRSGALPRTVFRPLDADDLAYQRLVERTRAIPGELHIEGIGHALISITGGDEPTVTGPALRMFGAGVLAGATVLVAPEDVTEACRRLPGVAVEAWDSP